MPPNTSSLVYDGFISYSHAADDLLAPRLQAGLQKFAKPWWKRRAVRIFRDESSLSANPHLWSSITEALDTSGWFVLLLSPDAATSEWVNQEIAYWVEHRDPNRILPVVTDGEFGWADGDVTGDAVPDALRGVFAEEPRWVDLRFARGEEQLDLQHPAFNSAIADIASAIRGIPKDELASEEVRQHRRTVRTAWLAGVALLVLGIAATIGAIVAVDRSNEAQRLATAESEARADADANAALARARELAASAINLLDEDPELSILLTLEAIDQTPTGFEQPPEVIDALWTAIQQDRLVRVVETGYYDGVFVALSPDDATLFVVNGFPSASGFPAALALQAYSTSDFEKLWEYRDDVAELDESGVPDGDRRFLFLHVSPDGDRVSLGLRGVPARFVVLSASDGEILHVTPYPDCAFPVPWGWSPDGTAFAVTGQCPQDDGSVEGWIEIRDGATFAPLSRTAIAAPLGGLSFDGTGRLFAFSADEETTVFAPPDYQEPMTLQGVRGIGDVSTDGAVVVTIESPADPCQLGLALNRRPDCGTLASFSTTTGERIDLLTPLPALPPVEGMLFGFSGAERLFAVPTQGSKTLVWDIATGEQIAALPSGEGVNAAVSSNGRRVYIGGIAGTVTVWDLGPNVGLDGMGDLGDFSAIGVNTITSGQTLGAFVGTDRGSFTSQVFFFDLASGALVGEPVIGQQPIIPLTGDRFLITDPYLGAPLNPYAGSVTPYSWSVYDPMTGDRSRIAGCDLDLGTGLCPDGQPPFPYFWAASLDGSELVQFFPFGPFTLIDPISGDPVGELTPEGSFLFVGSFTEDWIAGATQNAFVMTDRETGESLASIDTGDRRFEADVETVAFVRSDSILLVDFETRERWGFPVEVGRVQGIAIDTDLRRVALGDENRVYVFDFDGQQLASVPVPRVSDLHWINEHRILVGTQSGTWATVSLLDGDLIASARASVTRGFTVEECSIYRIDPCPTLEEIQSR